MKKFFYVAVGVARVGVVWLGVLAAKHGWGWVLAQYRALKAKLEARAKAKADSLAAAAVNMDGGWPATN